ncbi:hypothetical protein FACS189437_02370 [Bacteroidia bacterium]|nr:hypothetical protein FACS189437_02370 [Bacteroidia bacterium]
MQSNIDLVRDDLQEFPDSWVELYNDSGQAVSIQNWYLSEKEDYNQGWKFNQWAVVPAYGYLLVYCDNVASGLHTSFRLDSGSGSVYLFDSDKNVVDFTTFPKQPAPNISRGRTTDGGSVWENFVTASPKQKNGGKVSDRILPNPVFSQQGGIYRQSVRVSLSLPENLPAGVSLSNIHYTLDNSEPTLNSPAYSKELLIATTTVLKAKIIHPDYLANRSQAHSYILVSKDMKLPVISISLDDSYLWDDEFGIYCRGNGKYGLTGNGVDYKANWNNDWRRPMNFEYFPSQNEGAVLNQLGEMRIAGGWSRANAQKTFIVYGHKRFGIKNFDYDLFSQKPGQDIRSFMIRNSGNDFWYTHFRDAAIQLFMGRKVDVDYQDYQPTIFYLNGKYWGIQNLRERSNDDFVFANYGMEDVDVIENWWGELKTGDKTDWNRLMTELRKSSTQMDYQWLINHVDIDEYINYMILEIYANNTDFPGNNLVMWKPKTVDGKWRFILKDLDQTLGIWNNYPPSQNSLQYNTENNNDDRKLFRALLTQNTFKKEFYSRFAIYMGDILQYKSTSQVIDSIQQMLEPAMEDHLLRWRNEVWWRDMNSWRNEISQMKTWCQQRNTYVYTHLKNYFNLGTVMKMTLETAPGLTGAPVVSINGTPLQKPAFDGSYFQKETIRLQFEGNDTAAYAWEITAVVNGTTTTNTYFQSDLSYDIADKCTSLRIKVVGNPTAISTVGSSPIIISAENNQLHLSGLEGKSLISVYDTAGRLVNQLQTNDYAAYLPVNQKGVLIVKINSPTQVVCRKMVAQ